MELIASGSAERKWYVIVTALITSFSVLVRRSIRALRSQTSHLSFFGAKLDAIVVRKCVVDRALFCIVAAGCCITSFSVLVRRQIQIVRDWLPRSKQPDFPSEIYSIFCGKRDAIVVRKYVVNCALFCIVVAGCCITSFSVLVRRSTTTNCS